MQLGQREDGQNKRQTEESKEGQEVEGQVDSEPKQLQKAGLGGRRIVTQSQRSVGSFAMRQSSGSSEYRNHNETV